MKHIERVVAALLHNEAWKATVYVSPKWTITACRRGLKKHPHLARYEAADIVLTLGKPNYEARRFIKKCQKTGEPFPIKKIQLKFPPTPRGK